MTGPEHYAEAERLIEAAKEDFRTADPDVPKPYMIAVERATMAMNAARIHATLALAAATAYPAIVAYCGDEATEPRDWAKAAS